MEGYDVIPDSYSAEVIAVMLVERIWSKIRSYLDDKTEAKKATKLEQRLAELESKIDINTALDKERQRK